MTPDRQQHLLATIRGLRSTDEALGFRMQLTEQGECVGMVKVMLEQKIAEMAGRG